MGRVRAEGVQRVTGGACRQRSLAPGIPAGLAHLPSLVKGAGAQLHAYREAEAGRARDATGEKQTVPGEALCLRGTRRVL